MVNISTPCKTEVEKYLCEWDLTERYVLHDSALKKLFKVVYPKNNNIDEILIKASALNDFYSTNIFLIYIVAKHILELNIDERLDNNDITLVNDIANVSIKGEKKYFYSFATKYCSHHNPDFFPIYDKYVSKCLMYFKRVDKFAKFTKNELRDYSKFKEVLIFFKEFYGIEEY